MMKKIYIFKKKTLNEKMSRSGDVIRNEKSKIKSVDVSSICK